MPQPRFNSDTASSHSATHRNESGAGSMSQRAETYTRSVDRADTIQNSATKRSLSSASHPDQVHKSTTGSDGDSEGTSGYAVQGFVEGMDYGERQVSEAPTEPCEDLSSNDSTPCQSPSTDSQKWQAAWNIAPQKEEQSLTRRGDNGVGGDRLLKPGEYRGHTGPSGVSAEESNGDLIRPFAKQKVKHERRLSALSDGLKPNSTSKVDGHSSQGEM